MTDSLLARKGEAVPSGLSASTRHAIAYYAARRTISFGQIDRDRPAGLPALAALVAGPSTAPTRPRPVAHIFVQPRASRDTRHRFTFRLDPATQERFRIAAQVAGCSRQKLLERALDALLDEVDEPAGVAPMPAHPAVPLLV